MSEKLNRLLVNLAALRSFDKAERKRIRSRYMTKAALAARAARDQGPETGSIYDFPERQIMARAQDMTFGLALEQSERLMVIVIPEHNEMSGGIYSMFSIAALSQRLRSLHGYDVVLMTRPNPADVTYCRQRNFRNAEDVYRFEQIERCRNLRELYIHVPEYATVDFVANMPPNVLKHILNVPTVHVNILNQNIDFMPEKEDFADLRRIADTLTQSVAHHAYFNQERTDRYQLPTLLLPAYTDLTPYPASEFEDKEKLIIHSPDEAPHREEVLEKLAAGLPDYEIREIRGITFDTYMDLATRCRFSVSFGEGFDGYIAQPIYQGGIGFTVYNEDYFPKTSDFLQYGNIFATEDEMVEEICTRIRHYERNPAAYKTLNRAFQDEYDKLYDYDGYVRQVKKLLKREFELFPGAPSEEHRRRGMLQRMFSANRRIRRKSRRKRR